MTDVAAVCVGLSAQAVISASAEDLTATTGAEFFRFPSDLFRAQHLFEKETFGGNGRTCLTCRPASGQGAGREFISSTAAPASSNAPTP